MKPTTRPPQQGRISSRAWTNADEIVQRTSACRLKSPEANLSGRAALELLRQLVHALREVRELQRQLG